MHLKYLFLVLLWLLFFLLPACDMQDTVDPDASFQLTGTWRLQQVDVTATLNGSAQADSDTSPSGTIHFSNNGTGVTAYTFEVFSVPFGSAGAFSWTQNGSSVTVVESTGIQNWSLRTTEPQRLVAEWTDFLDEEETVQGTFTITLVK